MNSELICAFASDDRESFMTRHFGDADIYIIYSISNENVRIIDEITNNVDEEENHADPKKAKSIAKILKSADVQVCVSPVFGPNIKRIKKKFVCIIMNETKIKRAVSIIQDHFDDIYDQWNRGKDRDIMHMGGDK